MLFRCFPYALVLGLAFFRFSDPFSSVSRGFLFLRERERERESMGLFCLLGSRLVKSVKFSRSLICNPTFSISFLVPSLRPCLCNPPPPQPIVIVIIIIIIDSLKPSHKPLWLAAVNIEIRICWFWSEAGACIYWDFKIFWNNCSELRDGTWAEGEDERGEGREMEGEKVEGGWEDGESEGDRVRVKRWLWYNDK